ncbi:MAG TPA: hypothetical protein VMK16_03690 [Acidimicrobiales bacterium]|nr:hypothetical protein [Acidimicrobiales bacterium]
MPDDEELERTLADHWQRVQQRGTYSITLAAPLDAVVEKGHFRVPDVPSTSKVPGGGAIHSLVGKTVTRHLTDLCEQLDEFARAVHGALVAIVEALDDPVPPEVQGRIDDVADQLTVLQRQLNALRRVDE